MYAENTGVGSRVSPCEMMIPRGSFDSFTLECFFIIRWEGERQIALSDTALSTRHTLLDDSGKFLLANDLRNRARGKA